MDSQISVIKQKMNSVIKVIISLIGLKLFIQLLRKVLFKDTHNIHKYKCTFKGRIYREKIKSYETELIEFVNKDFQKKNAKIIMIPGNPGLIKFYDSFLDELHRLLNREVEITGISHANHFISKKNRSVFDLDSQIDHKISFMLKQIKQNSEQKYILIGHSIGCYMILKMIEIQKIQDRVEQVILLYPTIERMRESPNGKRMWILAKWGIRTTLVVFFRFITLMLDNEDRQIFLSYLANVQNNDVKLKTVLLDLIDTNFLRNVLYLFKWELKQVVKLDYDQLNDLSNQITFYYGSNDQWTPMNYVEDLKKKVNRSNIKVMVDQQKIDHAFVLESSLKQARIVHSLIDDQNIY